MRGNDFYDYDRMQPEPGDLVIGRHVIRTGVDLMTVAMEQATETARLQGRVEALLEQVSVANERAAEHQVARTRAESDVQRLKANLERQEERTVQARRDLKALGDGVTKLAAAYRQSNAKPDCRTVADDLDGLLQPDEAGEPS